MTKVIGKAFTNHISGLALENGDWKVIVRMDETFTYDDKTEKVETIEAMCIDSDFVAAQQIAMVSALGQYRDEVYDKGMNSLIEAREKFGNPNDNSRDNKDTITQ
jgi:hypothetical protein